MIFGATKSRLHGTVGGGLALSECPWKALKVKRRNSDASSPFIREAMQGSAEHSMALIFAASAGALRCLGRPTRVLRAVVLWPCVVCRSDFSCWQARDPLKKVWLLMPTTKATSCAPDLRVCFFNHHQFMCPPPDAFVLFMRAQVSSTAAANQTAALRVQLGGQ